MQAYRIYFFGSDGHITEPPKVVQYPSDEGALSEAQQHLDGRTVEVWKGARMIAHFDPIHSPAITR
jgi:hypothetical protein